MRILDRHIARTVVVTSLLVMAVLLAMFTFFSVVDELSDLGRGSYGIGDAVQYVVLGLPRQAFELMPMAALIGSLLGLGALAGNGELTVVRAAGVSIERIGWAVMKGGAVLMVVAVVLGEGLAPPLDRFATERRNLAMATVQEHQGVWSRDASAFVNLRSFVAADEVGEITIHEFDEERRLRMMTWARRATYGDGAWLLEDVRQSEITDAGVVVRHLEQAAWTSRLVPALLGVVRVEPEQLPVWGLVRYVDYLEDTGQESAPHRLSLWGKLMNPVTTGVMILLAIPFVFGPLRAATVGSRVVVGALVGIGFHIINQTFTKMGLVYGFSPFISAVLPTLLFAGAALWMMRRVR